MSKKEKIIRKIAGWEFFNNEINVENYVNFPEGGIQNLPAGDKYVAEWFISALKEYRRIIDVGCGSGFPGLYVASYVKELVGIDAAPNMIAAAQSNIVKLGIKNAMFKAGGIDGLPFRDGEFHASLMSGVLESMDWQSVHLMISEVNRVLIPSGKITVLEQDWEDVLHNNPSKQTYIFNRDGKLMLQFLERRTSPHIEKTIKYTINSNSNFGKKLLTELRNKTSISTTTIYDNVEHGSILDAWENEVAQFDIKTLKELIASNGFTDISIDNPFVPGWDQKILFLTGIKKVSK